MRAPPNKWFTFAFPLNPPENTLPYLNLHACPCGPAPVQQRAATSTPQQQLALAAAQRLGERTKVDEGMYSKALTIWCLETLLGSHEFGLLICSLSTSQLCLSYMWSMAQALLGEATRERLKSASQCTPTRTKNRLADNTLKGLCASQTCSKPKAFTLSAIALSLSAAMQNRPHGPIIQNYATKGHLGSHCDSS